MDMLRVTARWSNFLGAPGYSNFFFAGGGGLISDAQQVAERVADAFDGLASRLPEDLVISIENEVAVVDSDSGEVQAYRNVEDVPSTVGLYRGKYSAPTGAVVNWRTDDVRFGRRIRGRTFLVPLANDAFQDDGTLSSPTILALNEFADIMTARDFDSEFGVWSRPRNGSGGVFATVTSYNVPDMAAVLRSRRD